MATAAALLYGDFPFEHAATRRVLARYPDGQGAWRPHEKSRTLSELATHIAALPNRGTAVIETDGMEMSGRPTVAPLDSANDLIAAFETGLARFTAALDAADFDSLERTWTLRQGERVVVERNKRELLRVMMMSHLIHHRAQLGVYYRLLGIPVPSVYGPSADEMA